MPLLIDDKLNLQFKVTQINSVVKNLLNLNYKSANIEINSNKDNSNFVLECSLDIDILQFLPEFKVIPCMNGNT